MNSLRRWLYRPKRADQSLLAQFYFADEELNSIAAELDSFEARKDPERCTTLVNQLRTCQARVLSIVFQMMEETVKDLRAPRDFRVKFPDDIIQENLAGQLWFGAECLAAGSSIMNREAESAAMRPLARALTKNLDSLRSILREQCLRSVHDYTRLIKESLIIFDKLFAEFELSYVSAMVPVKTAHEYDMIQEITVLFSETVQRALRLGLLTQDTIDEYDPALMFTIPRLAIVSGVLIFKDGPLNPDNDPWHISEMFRPFQTLLIKIRELLNILTDEEVRSLESALCSQAEPSFLAGLEEEKASASASAECMDNDQKPASTSKKEESEGDDNSVGSELTALEIAERLEALALNFIATRAARNKTSSETSSGGGRGRPSNVQGQSAHSPEGSSDTVSTTSSSTSSSSMSGEDGGEDKKEQNEDLATGNADSAEQRTEDVDSLNGNSETGATDKSLNCTSSNVPNATSSSDSIPSNECDDSPSVPNSDRSINGFPESPSDPNVPSVVDHPVPKCVDESECALTTIPTSCPQNNNASLTDGHSLSNPQVDSDVATTSHSEDCAEIHHDGRTSPHPPKSNSESESKVSHQETSSALNPAFPIDSSSVPGTDSPSSTTPGSSATSPADGLAKCDSIDSGLYSDLLSLSDSHNTLSSTDSHLPTTPNECPVLGDAPNGEDNSITKVHSDAEHHCRQQAQVCSSDDGPSDNSKHVQDENTSSPCEQDSSTAIRNNSTVANHNEEDCVAQPLDRGNCDTTETKQVKGSACLQLNSNSYHNYDTDLNSSSNQSSSDAAAPAPAAASTSSPSHSATQTSAAIDKVDDSVPLPLQSSEDRGEHGQELSPAHTLVAASRPSSLQTQVNSDVPNCVSVSNDVSGEVQNQKDSSSNAMPTSGSAVNGVQCNGDSCDVTAQDKAKASSSMETDVKYQPTNSQSKLSKGKTKKQVGAGCRKGNRSTGQSKRKSQALQNEKMAKRSADIDCASSDTSSYTSDSADKEEIALAMEAAEKATRTKVRAQFRSSNDMIHRLFVCISGVADQLQTNYAGDLRNILRAVFDMNCSYKAELGEGDMVEDTTPLGAAYRAIRASRRTRSIGQRQEPPVWLPDEQTNECMSCQVPFTFVRRRHHCRNCGKIYCSRCSNNFVPLPHFGEDRAVRVCNRCFMFQVTHFTPRTPS